MRTPFRTLTSRRATRERRHCGQDGAVPQADTRRARKRRRRSDPGAGRDVAHQREHRYPDQRGGRGERPLGQRHRLRRRGADDSDRPEQLAKGGASMGEKTVEYHKLTREELDRLAGEALPERAAMSLINANVAAPVNLALAANVLSDGSTAVANAEQTADIVQSN